MIHPTRFRAVHYHLAPGDTSIPDTVPGLPNPPLGGIITKVYNDRLIDVQVYGVDGNYYPKTSVQLLQDADVPPTDAQYCNWFETEVH